MIVLCNISLRGIRKRTICRGIKTEQVNETTLKRKTLSGLVTISFLNQILPDFISA